MQCKVQLLKRKINNMSKVPQYKRMNWVLYIEQENKKNKSKYDTILDKVLELATPLGSLYGVNELSVYNSDKSILIEFVFNKKHLFVITIPICELKELNNKQCEKLLNKLILGLNQAKKEIN